MKKNKKWPIIATVWSVGFILLLLIGARRSDVKSNIIGYDAFAGQAEIIQKEERVGAKVALKEAIHGTDGINYRYIIKTDCPSWDFETRYMSSTPVEWVTDDTAAVEVLIYDTQVRFDGTSYASGQYYIIPLFGGLSSETMSLEDWQTALVKQAYSVYQIDMTTVYDWAVNSFIFVLFVLLIGYASYSWVTKDTKKKTKIHPWPEESEDESPANPNK